eukprot:1157679-Pelagomonas_calceolata.AAC.14
MTKPSAVPENSGSQDSQVMCSSRPGAAHEPLQRIASAKLPPQAGTQSMGWRFHPFSGCHMTQQAAHSTMDKRACTMPTTTLM